MNTVNQSTICNKNTHRNCENYRNHCYNLQLPLQLLFALMHGRPILTWIIFKLYSANKPKLFCCCFFFIIIIYFARQNTETSSPLNVYSATVFGLCTALSRLMGRKYGMYEVYGTHGCLFSIHIRWMRMEGCFCVTVYVVGCCCSGCFFFCFLWKYRFCVQAKTHLKLFVPPTEKQAFHFWQRSFSGCSYPCSLYPMTLCVTLRRRGSMIFSSVTFVWMEIKACARWHAHFCNTRVLLVQRIFKCSCNASSCDEQ